MRAIHAAPAALVLLALLAAGASQDPADPRPDALRVGVFDSRAVAVAFAASDVFQAELKELRAEIASAREAGDDARATELAALGPARQARMHKQGFSTASIEDILAHVTDELPRVAAESGVSLIVSRWHIVHRAENVELVDVTAAMAALFDSSERTLEIIEAMKDQVPLPLYETDWEELERGH